ncbi:MAG: trigger factor [Alphaproteobacteria bacterium]|nr:trigger factor [Alphaproteobacteria bacterium]
MIQVKEVSHKELKHEFSIKVPADEVGQALTRRLEEIGKTAKIQGFRPGKAPLAILRQRFGAAAREEILDKTVSESAAKALDERNLRPAMQPQIEMISAEEGKDLEFKLTVEVLPEITPVDFGKLSFERLVADVDETDVDETIARLARSVRAPEAVTEPRAAQTGDVLVIAFDGTVDGTPFPGMKSEDHRLELGSRSFVGTFEEQLTGTKPGDRKKISVEFPEDYHAPHLAGKTAVFDVAVKELLAHKSAVIDDVLAKEVGFSSLADLRKRVADDIGARHAGISRAILKRELMDRLAKDQKFAIPGGLLDAEFNAIWQQVQKEKAQGNLSADDAKKSDDDLRAEYREIAERRIRLGLLLADVAKKGKIEVTQADLRNAMLAEARRFPGQEKAVVDYYLKTEGAMDRLRAPILEEKAVDYILAQAKISDKKLSASALLKRAEEQE